MNVFKPLNIWGRIFLDISVNEGRQLWFDAINMQRFPILYEFFRILLRHRPSSPPPPVPVPVPVTFFFGALINVVHAELIGHARCN